jgi:hypothetical protein
LRLCGEKEIELEEERIKSAFEIAMERISDLPGLTPEEIAEQKEKEYRPVGQALANKYLQGQIAKNELETELNGFQGEKGKIARAALVAALCQSIQLADIPKAERALQGLASLGAEEKDFEDIQSEFLQARGSLERDIQIEYKKYDEIVRGELENAGIRGSAVKPNLFENDGWLQRLIEMRRPYDSKLGGIKKKLMERLN